MSKTEKRSLTTREMAYIALFAIIIAICSWASVPGPVPFTMQTFAIFLSVGLLGGKRGTMAVAVYLLMGVFGLPVFAGFTGGIGRLLGATGGYIVGFLFSALIMWAMEKAFGRSGKVLLLSMVMGLLVCYALGTAWFVLVYNHVTGPMGWASALLICVVPYLVPDAAKIALAMLVCRRLRGLVRKALDGEEND